jgi:hypothetical protein
MDKIICVLKIKLNLEVKYFKNFIIQIKFYQNYYKKYK